MNFQPKSYKENFLKSKLSLACLAQNYISSGVACHALILLKKLGFLDELEKDGFLDLDALKTPPEKELLVRKALKELEINGIFQCTDERYSLTAFGQELVKYLGLMLYIYEGYSHVLSTHDELYNSNQMIKTNNNNINDEAVVVGSDDLAKNFIDPIIMKNYIELDLKSGFICDLGCGDCSRLNLMTKISNLPGIGIDNSNNSIKLAKKIAQSNPYLSVVKDDISSLKKIYPEVTILMQTMVFHDFTPTHKAVELLNMLLKKFPNTKYFLYCDIVAPSAKIKTQLPGFDYIHAALGIETRTYEETISMFKSSNFHIDSEHKVAGLNNTYLWILQPKSN